MKKRRPRTRSSSSSFTVPAPSASSSVVLSIVLTAIHSLCTTSIISSFIISYYLQHYKTDVVSFSSTSLTSNHHQHPVRFHHHHRHRHPLGLPMTSSSVNTVIFHPTDLLVYYATIQQELEDEDGANSIHTRILEGRHQKSMLRCVLNYYDPHATTAQKDDADAAGSSASSLLVSKGEFQHWLVFVERRYKWTITQQLLTRMITMTSTVLTLETVPDFFTGLQELGIGVPPEPPPPPWNRAEDPSKFLSKLARGRTYKGNFRQLLHDVVVSTRMEETTTRETPDLWSFYETITAGSGKTKTTRNATTKKTRTTPPPTTTNTIDRLQLFVDALEDDMRQHKQHQQQQQHAPADGTLNGKRTRIASRMSPEQIQLLRMICNLNEVYNNQNNNDDDNNNNNDTSTTIDNADSISSRLPSTRCRNDNDNANDDNDNDNDKNGLALGKLGEQNLKGYLQEKYEPEPRPKELVSPQSMVLSPVWVRAGKKVKRRRQQPQQRKTSTTATQNTHNKFPYVLETYNPNGVLPGMTSEFDAMVVRIIDPITARAYATDAAELSPPISSSSSSNNSSSNNNTTSTDNTSNGNTNNIDKITNSSNVDDRTDINYNHEQPKKKMIDDEDDTQEEEPVMIIVEVWDAKATLDPCALLDVLNKKIPSLTTILSFNSFTRTTNNDDKYNNNNRNNNECTKSFVNADDIINNSSPNNNKFNCNCEKSESENNDSTNNKDKGQQNNNTIFVVPGTNFVINHSHDKSNKISGSKEQRNDPTVYRVGIKTDNENSSVVISSGNHDDASKGTSKDESTSSSSSSSLMMLPHIGVYTNRLLSPKSAARRIQTIVYERMLTNDIDLVKYIVGMKMKQQKQQPMYSNGNKNCNEDNSLNDHSLDYYCNDDSWKIKFNSELLKQSMTIIDGITQRIEVIRPVVVVHRDSY